eukprot:8102514-Lingulodinium_polyedra.AAC.1
MIDWKSWKLKRVCRSSLSVECQAMVESLDSLNFVRFFCGSWLGAALLDTESSRIENLRKFQKLR